MKVLIVGAGGREHALAAAMAREDVLCAPGNPGIAAVARTVPVDAADVPGLLSLASAERVDLTIVGPELPLDHGIADAFAAAGQRILGPTRAAAQLECSKAFAKDFMARHGIPTARYRVCATAADARAILASGEFGLPVVLKADGLAGGKGVVVAATAAEAQAAVHAAMDDRRFGDAGARLVIEECLSGPEVSFFALCDGERAVPFGSAQDHKRIFDGDRGPNTGGMGAFAPSPLVDPALAAHVMSDIVMPVVRGMRQEGVPYRGFLYVGLMLTCAGPKVIEFNVRFGDPEAQVVLPLADASLLSRLVSAADGTLDDRPVGSRPGVAVGIVLAAAGYPGAVQAGAVIHGLSEAAGLPGVQVFHAGTAARDGAIVTAGGRVLTLVATADRYQTAIDRAYAAASLISFEGMQYRRDIGAAAVAHR